MPVLDPVHFVKINATDEGAMGTIAALVAGYVEGLHPCGAPCHQVPGWHAYLNAEAAARQLAPNHRAARLATRGGWHEWSNLELLGTVVFTGCPGDYPYSTDVPDGLLAVAARIGINPLPDSY